MATSSKRAYAIPRSAAPRAPAPAAVHGWPYLHRRTKPLFTSKNQCLKWTKCTCILAREMEVNSRHQYQNQFRTDSTREQVWEGGGLLSFHLQELLYSVTNIIHMITEDRLWAAGPGTEEHHTSFTCSLTEPSLMPQSSGVFLRYWICLAGSRSYTFPMIQGSLGKNFRASKLRWISRYIPKPATIFQMNQEKQDMECRNESQCHCNYPKKQNKMLLVTTVA